METGGVPPTKPQKAGGGRGPHSARLSVLEGHVPLPDGSTAVVIATPFGGDLTPVVPAIYRNRTLLRNLSPEVKDPRNGKRIYVHPDPVSVIGDEYSRGRNEIVNL